MMNPDGDIHGKRITLLTLFHFIILLSHKKGTHLSFGVGVGPCELAVQASAWSVKEMWNDNVGSA
jgi:hypothetical protein